jgi:hypothetical protein
MTLEEEILKLDLIASDAFEGGDANEFKQLAEWLRELKGYREARQELEDRHAVGTLDLIDSYIEEVNADEDSD